MLQEEKNEEEEASPEVIHRKLQLTPALVLQWFFIPREG